MAEKQTLTASQRAALFSQATRQNHQMLPTQTATSGASTLTFTFPKARLLSKVLLDIEMKTKITHASKTDLPTDLTVFNPYSLIRRISLDMNNGFHPYVIGGAECAMLNMISRNNPAYIYDVINKADESGYGYWKNKGASSTGKENTIGFTLELPITLNDRDPVSLIMLQNEQTVVNLTVDIANGAELLNHAEGYSVEITEVKVTPMAETFSIPASTDAFPDISVLKLTASRNDNFVGAGQHIVKLSTGTIYRRLLFRILNKDGKPMETSDITSNIELVFNQADTNYSISPRALRRLNTTQYGYSLPKGMYVFDFAFQGTVNLSGTRDYVDTERLTEMWLRFSTNDSGTIQIVSETIARLA